MSKGTICSNCQATVPENSKFCSRCGEKYIKPKIVFKPKTKSSQSSNTSYSAANDNIKLIAGIVIGILGGGIAGYAFIDDGSTTISSLELGISALESEKNQLLSDINNISTELERVKEFEGKVPELELSLQTVNNEKNVLNAQLIQINGEKDSLETQVSDLDGQITELNAEIQELNDEVAEGNQEILDLNAEVLKASQANAMIASLESEVSELERLKNSLQIQINDLNNRISILENSIADKDALIAGHELTIEDLVANVNNQYLTILSERDGLFVEGSEGYCWTVSLHNWENIDAVQEEWLHTYSGYFVVDFTSTTKMDIRLVNDQGRWTNDNDKSSDIIWIPHTPETITISDNNETWKLWFCGGNQDFTLSYKLSFRY